MDMAGSIGVGYFISKFLFFAIMFVQVLTEEKRLRQDFGEEYESYCRRTGRFLPF